MGASALRAGDARHGSGVRTEPEPTAEPARSAPPGKLGCGGAGRAVGAEPQVAAVRAPRGFRLPGRDGLIGVSSS